MAEEHLFQVDTDWKKQAQEEKRKLAEQGAKAKAAPPASPSPALTTSDASTATAPGTRRPGRALPQPGFGSLVQSVMTQIFYYLGEIASSSGQGSIDLDLAKHHLDTLSMLEEKTQNNLSKEEQTLLDTALYETRTRFINIASQFLGP